MQSEAGTINEATAVTVATKLRTHKRTAIALNVKIAAVSDRHCNTACYH